MLYLMTREFFSCEGGQLPWKRQSIDEHRGPAGDYAGLRDPLPPPPLGVGWSMFFH